MVLTCEIYLFCSHEFFKEYLIRRKNIHDNNKNDQPLRVRLSAQLVKISY